MNLNFADSPASGVSAQHEYLTDVSSRDKPWDIHKSQSGSLSQLYGGTDLSKLSERLQQCGGLLEFGWTQPDQPDGLRLQLKSARFCRVRHCPICQWRRALMWVARFLRAVPQLRENYPTARFLFLTLTIQNCELSELRASLKLMTAAFNNLQRRKDWPAIGWLRATEVTRGKDGTAHPHFHCILVVPASYFKSRGYLSQVAWRGHWQSALGVSYEPWLHVRAVRPNKRRSEGKKLASEGTFDSGEDAALSAAVVETLKYSTKPEDLIGQGTEADRVWLLELTKQLHKTRAVAIGGVLKHYLSESEPEDLVTETDSAELASGSLWFGWREMVKRYVKEYS